MPEPIRVRLLSKPDCHLCEVAKSVMMQVQRSCPFELEVVDITRDEALFEEFKEQIPVIFVNGSKAFKYRVTATEFENRLRRAALAA